MIKERDFSLDVVRVVAVFLVITVHFFLYSGYYKVPFTGVDMFIMEAIRIFSMTCVPLFLLLTGYLKNGKKINKKYYFGIIPIYVVYVLCSFVVLLFKKYYVGQDISFLLMIKKTLNFTGANYAWYVEMYLGLYLLIPFLNVLWNNLKNKSEHLMLIITLIVCTTLTSILNVFNFSSNISDFFLAKNGSDQLIPDWWVNLYPLMYYFIGCYICKYREDLKFQTRKIFFTLVCCCFVFAFFNYFRSFGSVLNKESFNYNWYGFEILINSFLLFILIKNVKFKKVPNVLKKTITKMSTISFGTYLISCIFDTIFYDYICKSVSIGTERWFYFPVVFIIFLCSNLLSLFLYVVKDKLIIVFEFLRKRICNIHS